MALNGQLLTCSLLVGICPISFVPAAPGLIQHKAVRDSAVFPKSIPGEHLFLEKLLNKQAKTLHSQIRWRDSSSCMCFWEIHTAQKYIKGSDELCGKEEHLTLTHQFPNFLTTELFCYRTPINISRNQDFVKDIGGIIGVEELENLGFRYLNIYLTGC